MEEDRRTAPEPIQRIVLLGFMCSGKSTVGASLARRLEWGFLDFDVEIEAREGRTIGAMVDAEGEGYLRAREAELTAEVADSSALVVAPGGGWITEPELLGSMRPGTLAVWLRVSPEETARRLMEDTIDRPFRDLPDPLTPIRSMMAEREPLYRLADLAVNAGADSVEAVAFEVEMVVRREGFVRGSR